jgi:hypothetical protein
MKTLSTKTHGVMDYLVGILIAASPWLFNYARGGAETFIPVAVGLTGLVYSLMTNYELGAVKLIPMRTHLVLDYVSGLLLAASPWLFGFNDFVFWPHVLLGVVEVATAAMTESEPGHVTTHQHH